MLPPIHFFTLSPMRLFSTNFLLLISLSLPSALCLSRFYSLPLSFTPCLSSTLCSMSLSLCSMSLSLCCRSLSLYSMLLSLCFMSLYLSIILSLSFNILLIQSFLSLSLVRTFTLNCSFFSAPSFASDLTICFIVGGTLHWHLTLNHS